MQICALNVLFKSAKLQSSYLRHLHNPIFIAHFFFFGDTFFKIKSMWSSNQYWLGEKIAFQCSTWLRLSPSRISDLWYDVCSAFWVNACANGRGRRKKVACVVKKNVQLVFISAHHFSFSFSKMNSYSIIYKMHPCCGFKDQKVWGVFIKPGIY